jgi:hypothetical protein
VVLKRGLDPTSTEYEPTVTISVSTWIPFRGAPQFNGSEDIFCEDLNWIKCF